jgi:dihydropteroate synthase
MEGRSLVTEPIFSREGVTIVGVLNLTPDSFSDGGRFVGAGVGVHLESAVAAARELVEAGAAIVDIGGESTRPGAEEVPSELEIARTVPVIEALRSRGVNARLSIDTRKSEVAEAAVDAGAVIINDVSGLRWDPALAQVAAARGAALILGHMRETPATMQNSPSFDDTLREVVTELQESTEIARQAGVSDAQLAVDPGIGFGKRLADNLQLIAHVGWLREALGLPVLLGPSRKKFLGELTGDPVAERDIATHAACAVAAFAGADAVRVHDVAGARRAVAVGRALRDARRKEIS